MVVVLNGRKRATLVIPADVRPNGIVTVVAAAREHWRAFCVRDAGLLRIPFTTSRFAAFRELAAPTPAVTAHVGVDPLTVPTPDHVAELDKAASELERGATSLRDELIDRAGFEALRLIERDARAARDEMVRTIAVTTGADIFGALPDEVTVEQAFAGADVGSQLRAICIRSPESLQLRHDLAGRTTPTLRARPDATAAWQALATRWVWSSDGTVVLALPLEDPHRGATAELQVSLRYERDLGDEDEVTDHRYDRPVRRRGGESDAENATIMWRRHADD